MQSESTQHSDNKHRHAHHRDHSDLDRSTRSFGSSSSGVGIASTFLQNQISLQRTLNDWDETNPEYMARKKSLEEEKEQDNEKKLAFPPSGSVALSSPSSNNCTKVVCNPPAIDTVPTEGGFLHASYTFDDEMMMMDIGDVNADGDSESSEDCTSEHKSELDAVYRNGKPIPRSKESSRVTLDSSSCHAGNGEREAAVSPSSTETIKSLEDDQDTHNSLGRNKRTSSTVSLVSMLKLQSISEHDPYQDNIDFVRLRDSDENSVISALGASNRDGCYAAENLSDDEASIDAAEDAVAASDPLEESNGTEDVDKEHNIGDDSLNDGASIDSSGRVRIDIVPLNCGKESSDFALKTSGNGSELSELSEELGGHIVQPKSHGSFLPLPDTERVEIQNLPQQQQTRSPHMKPGTEGEDISTSTFFLQSLKSEGHVTHMSDAPSYDYNSISSSDEDAKATLNTQGNNKTEETKLEEYISPTERKRRAKELELCGLLGLPKDEGAQKLSRGIMSRNTEVQLRNLLNIERDQQQQDHHHHQQQQEQITENTTAAETLPAAVNDSDTSEDSSSKKALEDQKWEAIRQRRLLRRASQGSKKKSSRNIDIEVTEDLVTDLQQGDNDGDGNNFKKGDMGQHSGLIHSNKVDFAETNGDCQTYGRKDSSKSTRSQSQSSLHSVRSSEVPKRAMRVERDDDEISVFTAFSKSLKRGLLGQGHRDSTSTADSHVQPSRHFERQSSGFMNILGRTKSLNEDEPSCSIDSKPRRQSKRNSLAVFLGLKHDQHSCSDDESTDDEDDHIGWNNNILSEGEYYLAMSMLVYIYALLRETAMLGHTDISFDEVDVNSFQSEVSDGKSQGILTKTKSAGFIIRVVLDELEKKDAFDTVSDKSVLREFKTWVHQSRCKQLDLATERDLRRKVARTRWKRAISTVKISIRLKKSSKQIKVNPNALKSDPSINKTPKQSSGIRARNRPAALSQSMMWVSSAKTQIMNSLGVQSDLSTSKAIPDNKLMGEKDLKQIIDDALEQPKFFRPGSLMRGTVNSHNWLMNMRFSMAEHINPITEDYFGRSPYFGLHTGFSLYLSRQRKDDSNTKIEEIFAMISEIGKAIAPEGDYELSITGHSLGGALATLLRQSEFSHSQLQELDVKGKLRLARFSNTRDIVPLIPFTGVDGLKLGRPYMHVGMHVRLHGTSNWAQYWLRNALDVSYPKHQDVLSHVRRGFLNSVFTNLNTLKGYIKNHTLSEYQKRIHFACEYRKLLAKSSFQYDKKRNRVKTLEEYYFIRGGSSVTCTKNLTKVNLEKIANERHRRQTRQFVKVLALIALVEGIVLLRIMDVSFPYRFIPNFLYPQRFDDKIFSAESNSGKFIHTTESTHHVSQVTHLNTTKSEDMSSEKGHISDRNDVHQPLTKALDLQSNKHLTSDYHRNIFRQMHWSVRTRFHHKIPEEIVQQRMSSVVARTNVDISKIESRPNISDQVMDML
eukprot:scaffold6685_cov55-Cyclotella_meneghiniana.AAC.1